jgi:hypothetical protein
VAASLRAPPPLSRSGAHRPPPSAPSPRAELELVGRLPPRTAAPEPSLSSPCRLPPLDLWARKGAEEQHDDAGCKEKEQSLRGCLHDRRTSMGKVVITLIFSQ